jgi:hypothetical protein
VQRTNEAELDSPKLCSLPTSNTNDINTPDNCIYTAEFYTYTPKRFSLAKGIALLDIKLLQVTIFHASRS